MVGGWLVGLGTLTEIENASIVLVCMPSVTLIATLAKVPAAFGVPESSPGEVLKLAQEGLFITEKTSPVPLAALVVGRNVYIVPSATSVGGSPEMVSGATTAMANGVSELVAWPSLTLMEMFG